MAFRIVHIVPMRKRAGDETIELDPNKVGRCEVRVDFDGVLETRHTHLITSDGDEGKKRTISRVWSIRNSTASLNEKLAAAKWAEAATTAVESLEEAVKDIEAKIAKIGRKKGIKALRGELGFAKTRLAETTIALEAAKANREAAAKANPEFVTFPMIHSRPQDAVR